MILIHIDYYISIAFLPSLNIKLYIVIHNFNENKDFMMKDFCVLLEGEEKGKGQNYKHNL